MASASDFLLIVRHLGPAWLLRRGAYAARRRLGLLERSMPRVPWSSCPAPVLHLQEAPARPAGFAVPERRVAAGRFPFFSDRVVEAGRPPDWHRHQVGGAVLPGDVHWSRLGDFASGDIKEVWELSRFGWAYELVRRGGAESAEVFASLFADWMARNPPNAGPNWMCGQEASIRLQAVVFAVERLGAGVVPADALARFVVATGRRIEANLGYALAQQNNHGVSECVGLLTAALLVADGPEARRWRGLALRNLARQVEELFYADGSFAQHSLIYHRLALSQLAWAALRLRGAGLEVPPWLLAAGRRATDFLAAITDPRTGEAPLYGANDGADLLPLSSCAFLDQRPAVQLGCAVFSQSLRYPPGPWDEPACWLVEGAARLPRTEAALADWRAPEGGLVQLCAGDSRLILRCPERFRHRPGQADFGHVDVWLGGRRIAGDGGSFSYNSRERFTALGQLREHNAVTVDGIEPLRKVTRFLSVPWPRGVLRVGEGAAEYEPDLWPGAGITWRRRVARREGGFVVADTLAGVAGRQLRWHWRLVDADWRIANQGGEIAADAVGARLRWTLPAGFAARLVRADAGSATGWESRSYGRATPAVALVIEGRAAGDVVAGFEFAAL